MEIETVKRKEIKVAPSIRFQEFNNTWFLQSLGSLLSFKNGLNSDKGKYGRGVKFINVLDIINNDFITYNNIMGSVEVTEKEIEKNSVEYGDILFQRSSETREEVGQANVYLDKERTAVFGGFVIRGKKIEDYNPRFLNYLLKTASARKEITSKSGGSTRYNVGQETLKEVVITTTSLSEQQKIASFLSAVDKKIQQLTRKKALLETYKKGVMQKLFSQEIRFRDENGKDFPEWEEKTLGELADRITQKNTDDKINFVLTNSATQGIISQNDYFDRDIANQNNLQGYYVVSKDDFVYNPRISVHAPVGPIKRNKFRKGVMSPLYSVFRFKDDKNLVFLEYFFETVLWHKYLNSVANFGARHDRMNISLNDFYLMPIPFPVVEEQQKIADFLSAIDKKIEAVSQQIEKTQSFKKGLLQQMFV